MKNNLLKLVVCIFALGLAAAPAPAQTKTSHDFSSFDALEVDFDFNIRVVDARDYSVSMNLENDLKDYVQAYVKNHTLYLALDEKKLPSDLRKRYRGRRSASPVLDVTVYTPDALGSVKMKGSSSLAVEFDIECRDFVLDLSENARVTKLVVDASNITVTMAGKSSASGIALFADDIKLNVAGSAKLDTEQDSQRIEIVAGGSAQLDVEGETLDARLTTSGSSKTTIVGMTNSLTVNGSSSSNVDALSLKTAECTARLSNSSKLYEAATETLHIDISGNSTLVFDGDPVIDIINVKSSTVQRYSGSNGRR